MHAHYYSKALKEALQDKTPAEQKKVLAQFLSRIKRMRHAKLLPAILSQLEKGDGNKGKELLVVGKRKDVARARKEAGTKVGAVINKDLIGGWQHYKDGILTDTSYKRSLVELYRNITK
ncbi:MAG: hypothetical protein ACJKSS_02700 [Patescibacteria group bacterium UBA2103]